MKPPSHLKAKGPGRRFWAEVHTQFDVVDPHHLELLGQACGCLDAIKRAQEEIKTAGHYFKDRFGQPKAHPAYAVIKDCRVLFARLLRELRLDIESPPESRPPRLY